MPASTEFDIISRWFERPPKDPAIRLGIGDDAAVVQTSGLLAIAVDMLVAGTHFPDGLAADAIGHRALAVNLSDLAAMGARPRWATLALSLPDTDAAWLEAFAAGFFRLAGQHSVDLIGGDTTRGPLSVTVQLIGDAPTVPLTRSAGRPGDRILVSGTLGDSAAGLGLLDAEPMATATEVSELLQRFSYPEPRLALGQALVGIAHAAIDISDGLVADLGHICEQSGTGAVIDLDRLPKSAALRAVYGEAQCEALALQGGDDYELCFCVPVAELPRIHELARAAATPVTEIGQLTEEAGIFGQRDGELTELFVEGFAHF